MQLVPAATGLRLGFGERGKGAGLLRACTSHGELELLLAWAPLRSALLCWGTQGKWVLPGRVGSAGAPLPGRVGAAQRAARGAEGLLGAGIRAGSGAAVLSPGERRINQQEKIFE